MAKSLILGLILACWAQIWTSIFFFFSWISPLLDDRHCRKLSFCAISRKAYDPNSSKWRKTLFWAWFRPIKPKFEPPFFLLKNLALSVIRYHDQVSKCKIWKKKLMIQSWEHLVTDGQTHRQQTDRRTYRERDWFHKTLVWTTSNLIGKHSF